MKLNRTQTNTDITSNVYTNTIGLIKGDTVKDRMLNFSESFLNILTDADQPSGYVSIDSLGNANITTIKAATPSGKFLRDDGTWNTLGATWGGITGLITNQTDLISLVNTRLALSDVDTDIALTANSDSKVASQKAIKTYVGNQLAGYQLLVSPGTTSQYWRGDKTWQTLALDTVLGIANTTGPNDIIATNNSKYRSSDGSVNLNISNSALIEFTNTDGFYTYSLDSDATSQYIQMRSYDNATTLELAYLQAFYQQVNMGVYSAATSGRLTQLEITNGEIKTNIVNNLTFEGIKYNADFSANYTNRSLVDKGYVTGGFVPYTGATTRLEMGANDILFDSGYGIDTQATVGTDILNIGATNAEVINYGNAATIHNFLGTAIYELQVNSYVTDKLITLNYGGALASGIGVGFEIEENSVITGFLKTNASRNAYSFKTPAINFHSDFSLASLTANRTHTLPDQDGTFTVLGNTTTGSGSTLVLSTSPTFTTQINVNGLVNIIRTSEQLRVGYDGSNYFSTTVSSVGNTTFALTGTSPTFTFNNSVKVNANDLQVGTGTMVGSLRGLEISYTNNNANFYMRNNLTSSKSFLLIGDATYAKSLRFQYVGSTFATSGIEQADSSNLFSVGNKLNIGTYGSHDLTFWSNNTQRGSLSSSGIFTFGTTNQQIVFTPTAAAPTLVQTGSASSTINCITGTVSGFIKTDTGSFLIGTSSAHNTEIYYNGTKNFTMGAKFSFTDAIDMAFGTTTGSKIGENASQKIGKWGVTPIVQPSGWGTPTGSVTRTTFDTTTVTLSELAERVAGLITDLKATGEIGA